MMIQENILQRWFDSEDAQWQYCLELPYRIRSWRTYYGSGRTHFGSVGSRVYYVYVQKTDWTWHDYFTLHQKARIYQSIRFICNSAEIDNSSNWWSPWFKIFLVKYMPRDNWMLDHDVKCTLSTIIWEIHIAAHSDYMIEFSLTHLDSMIIANEEKQRFDMFVSFQGQISVEEEARPTNLFSFPFYCCYRVNEPNWLYVPHEAVAPSREELEAYYGNSRGPIQRRSPSPENSRDHIHDYEDHANDD